MSSTDSSVTATMPGGAVPRASIPAALQLSYLLFPLSSYACELLGTLLWRNWIDFAWVAVAFAAWLSQRESAALEERFGRWTALCALASLIILIGVVEGRAPALTAALEVKPFFYLLVAMLLWRSGRMPSPEAFCRVGSLLSVVLVAETALRSVVAGNLERPVGSGEVNYDAALLMLSLVFALGERRLARRYAPLIFLGLLATFSRTSLLAACAVLVFARTVPMPIRLLMIASAIGAALLSFLIRGLEVGALESMDRYWMWLVGLEHLSSHWQSTLVNTTPGSEIETDVPPFIAELWLSQQEKVDVEGIFPFHFHAMWLRLVMAWGWLPVAVALLMILQLMIWPGRRPAEARIFLAACLVLGLTMGLFYLSNVAVPMFLAALRVLPRINRPRKRRSMRQSAPPVAGA